VQAYPCCIPICSVVPPYLLRSIAARGDEEDRARALAALELQSLRQERAATAVVAGPLLLPRATKRRTVFDARNTRELPGLHVRGEGERRVRDVAVNEAYEGAGATYDFFRRVYGRRSIDDHGLRLDSTVHFGEHFNNAHWNGAQMVYGDGDGKYFRRFTGSLEVIAHELTHGIIQCTAGLGASGQCGALGEHFADVFGVLVKQYRLRQKASQATWLVGEELFTERVCGVAIRSMKAPGKAYDDRILGDDPQPSHMRHFVRSSGDDRGVHVNSGIPNHAFYVTATLLGGYAWEIAGRIWYRALTRELGPRANFQQCAEATSRAAAALYGIRSGPQQAVQEGWKAVGMDVRTGFDRAQFEPPMAAAELPYLV
jgi:Zn-dependent metalloprotease